VALGDGDQDGHAVLDCRRADHNPAGRGHQVLVLPDRISRNGQISTLSHDVLSPLSRRQFERRAADRT